MSVDNDEIFWQSAEGGGVVSNHRAAALILPTTEKMLTLTNSQRQDFVRDHSDLERLVFSNATVN